MQSKASRTGLLLSVGLACVLGASAVVVACATEASQPSGLLEPDASTEGGGHDGSSSGSTSSSGSSSGSTSSSGSSSGTTSSSGGGCNANLQTDPQNCGSCGHACSSGQICSGGQCQAPCVAPQVSCPSETGCFDLTSDPSNCGSCANVCPAPSGGSVTPLVGCVASQCTFSCPADAGVPDGGGPVAECGADGGLVGCFDLSSSPLNCGACGTQCQTGEVCAASHCCPTGNTSFCGGACVNEQTDPNNCGGCDAGCPSPASCSGGVCVGYTQTTNPTGVSFVNACTVASPTPTVVLKNQGGGWVSTPLKTPLSLPFTFSFFGTPQTQFWLQNQGTMGIGAPSTSVFNAPDGYPDCHDTSDPTTGYPAIVAFGDYELATGPSGVCYVTTGTAPNQQFVVTWAGATDQGDPGSVLTFSIVLTQTTNTIDLMYGTMTGGADAGLDPTVSGTNATAGLQGKPNGGTLVASPLSCYASFLTSTPTIYRFTPAQ